MLLVLVALGLVLLVTRARGTGRGESSIQIWERRQASEPFVVPRKSGHSSREDPAEGREGRFAEPRSGHKARTPSLDPPVHATAADSTAGERTRDVTSRMP